LEARYVAQRAAFAAAGVVFLVIGLAILGIAGWIMLAEIRNPVFASLVVGSFFCGVGLILLGLSRRAYRARDIRLAAETGAAAANPATREALPPLAEAFLAGLNAGMRRR
jgi:membrane-bound ClpP family serine protease